MEKKLSRRDFLMASVAASAVVTAGAALSSRGASARELRPIQLSGSESARAGGLLKILLSGADTAFIAENVYLYCAAEGLATVVRADIDRPALAKAMKLRQDQTVTLAQSIGYPKKGA